jgi:TonB family protein
MIMPLLRGEEMAGIFEVFSSAPRAFGERDELTLKALAGRILSNLERASRPESATAALPAPLPVQWESLPAADTPQKEIPVTPVDESQRGVEQNLERKFDWITFALGAAVLACAVLLGVLMVVHLTMPTREKTTSRPHASARLSGGDAAPAGVSAPVDASASAKQETANPAARPARPKWNDKGVPPGGLRVFENGKEVFRLPPQSPAATAPDEMQSGSSGGADKVVQLSPAMAASSLLRRVEPEYPSVALQQKIQGSVVMDLHIGADGAVQDVQVVSGPPQLAAAATDAVRQWRYSPRILNGHPAKMQTRLKLDFKLPQ